MTYKENLQSKEDQQKIIVTARCLGFPVADAPEDARQISYLKAWQNKVYIGYGNWSSNSVIVSIRNYSPQDCQFHTENVYYNFNQTTNPTTVEVAIDRYDIIDGNLYIPGTDPDDGITGWRIGTFYRNDGSGWVMYNNIPSVAHNFDMIKYQNKLFAALGGTNSTCLQCSIDNGNNWQVAIDPLDTDQQRFNQLFEIESMIPTNSLTILKLQTD